MEDEREQFRVQENFRGEEIRRRNAALIITITKDEIVNVLKKMKGK